MRLLRNHQFVVAIVAVAAFLLDWFVRPIVSLNIERWAKSKRADKLLADGWPERVMELISGILVGYVFPNIGPFLLGLAACAFVFGIQDMRNRRRGRDMQPIRSETETTAMASAYDEAIEANLIQLANFANVHLFPAIDRLDGLIDEATVSALTHGDIVGVLLRYYLSSSMTRYRDEAQRTLERKIGGKTVNLNLLERSLCDTIDAYRTVSSATHKALAPADPATTFGQLYRRWKQADEEVDRSLSELLGALPANSVLRARLRLIRSRFRHIE